MVWKNEKMVLAGKKAHITKLKNLGRIEEAKKLEESLINIDALDVQVRGQDLKPVKIVYDVAHVRVETDSSLPWVEKYRPITLADLIGEVSPFLRAFVKTDSFPMAFVFFGDYGQGKTAAAGAFIRDYFVNQGVFRPEATFADVLHGRHWSEVYEGCWSPVLYIDATIDSDVDMIRDRVLNFMKVRSVWNSAGLKLKKFVLFDEADRLGYAAQGVLRSLLEKYPGTITIYTTNRVESVDPAIISRASGGVFEFKKPSKESLIEHLREILRLEGKSLSSQVVEEMAVGSRSVREAVGRLQQIVALESV